MRNRKRQDLTLSSEYGHIDYDVLYRTIIDDVPDLIQQLDAVLQTNQP